MPKQIRCSKLSRKYRIDILLASVFRALANPYARTLDLEFGMGPR